MGKEILVGVISAVVASIITFIAIGSKEILTDIQLVELSNKVVNNDSFNEVLLDKFSKDDRFTPVDGKDGRDGKDGKSLIVESGVWPIGNGKKGGGCKRQGKDINWSTKIKYSKNFSSKPDISYGITFLDINTGLGAEQSNGVRIFKSNESKTGFTLNAHSWMGCTYNVAVSWVAIGE